MAWDPGTKSDALGDLSEKELLLEIFRQVRGVRRLLIWTVVVAPAILAVLTLIATVTQTPSVN